MFTEDQSQMLIFIILSFLDPLSLGKKRIRVKLTWNSPFLCTLSISQHTFPDLLQPKLGVIFFPTGLTLFYLQFLFSGNALMLKTPEYTDLLFNSYSLCPKSHPQSQMFSTQTEGGRIKGGEGQRKAESESVCVCVISKLQISIYRLSSLTFCGCFPCKKALIYPMI